MAGFEAIQVMVTEVKLLKYCQRKPQVAGYASMTKRRAFMLWTDEEVWHYLCQNVPDRHLGNKFELEPFGDGMG